MIDQTNPAPNQAEGKSEEIPKYRLTEPAYINERHFDQHAIDGGKAVIFFDGIPGAHMLPLNDAAKAMVKKHQPKRGNPVDELTIVGPGATVLTPHNVPGKPGS